MKGRGHNRWRWAALMLGASVMGCSTDALVRWMITPGDSFEEVAPAPVPDYRLPSSWAALPHGIDNADVIPPGLSDTQGQAPADVFFVHPTTYYTGNSWNADIQTPMAKDILDEAVLTEAASVFNGCCRVYVPRYRQATIGTFLADPEVAQPVMELAYSDVRSAFQTYLTQHNGGRPFLIASHSQGTLHAMRLMEELDTHPARDRFVAAYLIGYRLPEDKFGTAFMNIGPCRAGTETGCIISWDTYSEGAEVRPSTEAMYWDGAQLVTGRERPTHCTNPLSWTTTSEAAPPDAHLGAARVDWIKRAPGLGVLMRSDESAGMKAGGLTALQPGLVGARCEGGILRITPIADEIFAKKIMFEEGNYHLIDINLFYENVRENAIARVAAFVAGRAVEMAPTPGPVEDGGQPEAVGTSGAAAK